MKTTLREEVAQLHAQICNALADPNRILLLYALAEGIRNVSELSDLLSLPQPTVSRHLKVLKDRDIVCAQRDGQMVYYVLKDSRVIAALDLLRTVLAEQLQNQVTLARRVIPLENAN
ncbi:MAG TPA: metalloregulator ArsR/SmtB family transcription factor [Aggregatilineales bacterium]|nr:winged helix-turn-helix transcriptional regulator [Anaerolineales bacterium]HRE49095.1 metalloregulator ArsR/SmtB family transcription factor [Aggregatilineales bacterium]